MRQALHRLRTILTLTCDQSTRLVSDRFERDLKGFERAALRLHLASCKGCRRMHRQFTLLRLLAGRARRVLHVGRHRLSPEARERIRQRLQES